MAIITLDILNTKLEAQATKINTLQVKLDVHSADHQRIEQKIDELDRKLTRVLTLLAGLESSVTNVHNIKEEILNQLSPDISKLAQASRRNKAVFRRRRQR